jgi:recombination protein RecT
MSNIIPYQAEIEASQRKFMDIVAKTNSGVVFEVESMFAVQAISKNSYLAEMANKNLPSLRNAIINVASVGLSLNPVTQYAYLVPREGQVCLDVSYKGLLKLATDSGSILWGRAELVYEKDIFKYKGPAAVPEHEADVFATDRGKFVGVYCVAKTVEGDFLVDIMNAKEIEQIQASSKTTKADTPWKKWFGEMAKKSIIKRASKTWPRSDKNERLAQAIQIVNQHEGIDFDQDQEGLEYISESQLSELETEIKDRSVDIDKFKTYAGVESLDQITTDKFPAIMVAVKSKVKS